MLKHADEVRTFGLAAEMSFWIFLSLIPLAAVAGLVAAKLAVHHFAVVAPFFTSLPPSANDFIKEQLEAVAAWNGGSVAFPAALVFVWLASSGVHSVFDALEIQTQSTRPWWRKRILAVAMCIGISVGVGLIAILTTGFAWISRVVSRGALTEIVEHSGTLGVVTRAIAGGLVLFGLNAALFWVGIPKTHRVRMPIAPGALLSTISEALLGLGYGVYVRTAGDGDAYQGALAIIGVTMTTLYLFSIAVLMGAELNRFIDARTRGVVRPAGRPSRLHRPRTTSDGVGAMSIRRS